MPFKGYCVKQSHCQKALYVLWCHLNKKEQATGSETKSKLKEAFKRSTDYIETAGLRGPEFSPVSEEQYKIIAKRVHETVYFVMSFFCDLSPELLRQRHRRL